MFSQAYNFAISDISSTKIIIFVHLHSRIYLKFPKMSEIIILRCNGRNCSVLFHFVFIILQNVKSRNKPEITDGNLCYTYKCI